MVSPVRASTSTQNVSGRADSAIELIHPTREFLATERPEKRSCEKSIPLDYETAKNLLQGSV